MSELNILLIDDDVDFADAAAMSLRSLGHNITVTHNWLSVMLKLKDGNFDAIVADIQTPTGNGLTAMGFLSQDPKISQIPKVFVSGLNDPETIQSCQSLNAMYLHKSATVFNELCATITYIAAQRELALA
ncbi:Gliding motility regulatory protein [Rubripirellula lacrimiformis]|uniref:Gliding motility regulatory protein n=1 Tax=Rubripirellula lacrimiformis TaxID=1930273 RepID=A0A517NEU5_9BACT|nr:response regulator [Rubripirellula lacrimiformis]QDT05568.1 Gliding motility regulatory protein [Rubripirellula lacrimiformis]